MVIVVVVLMVLMAPVAFVVLPPLVVVIVVRVGPIGAFIGRSLPSARHPDIAVTLHTPVARSPNEAWPGAHRHSLITHRRRW